ncbi:hypothetical protein [Curtobacterium sp. ISL-83]|uniref:hypothetical protein n=1 Tax=Curtobacterium sp. ISL-83 TaxID=2819145 RepID=UPI001BEB7D5A|nr:hypothetical protein [Curtobacterium sp. ISL-83]MBT2502342.1 hypothetical protein [Curtobacterium sp. ISL-83]
MTGPGAPGRVQPTVAVELARAALGAWHLARVGRPMNRSAAVDRVLGIRQVTQAGLVTRAGSGDAHTISALVDAAHGASMVPFALFGGRFRRFAAAQVLIALALTVAEIALVGRGDHR